MTFKDLIASDVANVFMDTDEYAEPVTYTPDGGSAVTVDAVVNVGGKSEDPTVGGTESISVIEVNLPRDATTGIADPSLDATITHNSLDYKVTEILGQDDDMTRLSCVRIVPVDRHKEGGYRKQ